MAQDWRCDCCCAVADRLGDVNRLMDDLGRLRYVYSLRRLRNMNRLFDDVRRLRNVYRLLDDVGR